MRAEALPNGRHQNVAAFPQCLAHPTQVASPGGGGDEFQRGFLEWAGDEEVVDHAGRAQPGGRWAAGGQRGHAQSWRGGLGERADIDDVPVGVGGYQWRWGLSVEGEVASVVVLDEKGSGRGYGVEHCVSTVGGQHGTVRVGVQRLAIEQPGSRLWMGFGYVTVFSMLLGFFAWYHGLAVGGVARVGQIQLVQPLLTLAWSAALLGEQIGPWTIVAALAILICVAATQQTRVFSDGKKCESRVRRADL